ncbi:MAG: hypothetical protein ABI638_14580 [Ignavibacteriota bacterium]
MSDCIYCGKSAGLFKEKHKECEKAFQTGNENILELISIYPKNEDSLEDFQNKLSAICPKSYISEEVKNETILKGMLTELGNFINQKKIDLIQLKKFFELIYYLNLKNQLSKNVSYINLITFISEKISDLISVNFFSQEIVKIETDINLVCGQLRLDSSFKNTTLIKSLEKAIYKSLDDGVITEVEEESIKEFIDHFQLSVDKLSNSKAYSKLVKSLILRDIFNGNLPKRIQITNQVPFNLQKNETLIWLINGVDYYTDKVRREYVGRTQGVSLRIVKGVYYRLGEFKGHPVDTVEKIYLGRGILGFTNKQLYFFNSQTSFRIRYDKIISVSPSSNGFTIIKDGVTAKPQAFIDGDGWFSYNLITNLSQIDLK